MYDVAIIGGGPIGIFSIFACGLEGLSCAILDSHSELGGQCQSQYSEKKIYDIPAHKEITGGNLIKNLLEQVSIFQYDSFVNCFVSAIEEIEGGFVVNSANSQIKARVIIVALGAGVYQPVKLSVPFDKELEGERILYKIENLNKFKNKEVAILGGGDSALDWALELSVVAKKIYLIHRRQLLNGNELNIRKLKEKKNIKQLMPYTIIKIEKNEGKLIIEGEEKIKVDYILPFYGSVSNTIFLREWNLKLQDSKILVNASSMNTSRKGVYAIGDCIIYEGKRNLIVTGFSEAMLASRAIFKYLNPHKAFNVSYSTNSDIFKS